MAYKGRIKELLTNVGAEPGDEIEFAFNAEIIRGILVPNSRVSPDDIIVIKLPNGYNAGLHVDPDSEIRVIEKIQKIEGKTTAPEDQDTNKPIISILHTGGTIASRVDYRTGGVSSSYSPEDVLAMFPEIHDKATIQSRLIGNVWSEDLRFEHYNLFAEEIRKDIESGVDGIILTHGTDTLAYTSAALSFILKDLPVPVILVGAQRSSDRPSSDSRTNLACAVNFITHSDFAEVAICMHANSSDDLCVILPACKTRKMHSSKRDAFQPINDKPWATVNYDNGKIEFLKTGYRKKDKNRSLIIMPFRENIKVGIIRIHTNMYPEQFGFYKDAGFDGLVIEGTGLGHTPGQEINRKIFEALKNLIESGCIAVMTSSTIYGRINMNVYTKGIELEKAGVLGNHTDMLPETAFIKLAWLLGNYSKEETKKLVGTNLRGEISTRTKK